VLSLDDVDAPLTVTALARKRAEVHTTKIAAVAPRPASAVRRSTRGRRTTPAIPAEPGVRPTAARPAVRRQDPDGGPAPQSAVDDTDPRRAG
jgi:hypothetical protein